MPVQQTKSPGAGFLVAILAGGVVLFLFTGIYVNLVTPFLAVFISLVVLILLKFLALEKEKSFIRNAFAHYLSNDVINELVSDPDKLNLGGERKYLTAMFTDVRGFSTISEQLDPTDLVKLLNTYLEEMSNIILDQRGTIDKYEGDAIIAFFGARWVIFMYGTGQIAPDLEWPIWIIYLAIPFGSGLMCYRFIQSLVKYLHRGEIVSAGPTADLREGVLDSLKEQAK